MRGWDSNRPGRAVKTFLDAAPVRSKTIAYAAVTIVAALALQAPASSRAEIVRDFSFKLKGLKASAAYTVVFSERSFDTTGAPVPSLTGYSLRFPLGMSIRPEVLRRRLFCDREKLRRFKNPRVCKNAQIGSGRAEADLLDANDKRVLSAPIPSDLYLFLAKPTTRGAVTTMLMLVVPDARAPIVKTIPNIRNTRLVGEAPFFDDPTADGIFGYRMELPPAIGGLRYNILEGSYSFPGVTLARRARKCRGSNAAPRCRRRRSRVKSIFWLTRPKCPASRKLAFRATYSYAALPSLTLTREIPCPKFPS
jgi:hypothetical protein